MTVKAARLIGAADVVAYHCAAARAQHRPRRSPRRTCATGRSRRRCVYPVTTETTDHPGGYRARSASSTTRPPRRLAEHLDAGRDVVVLCEGDPFFYGSYMHMHKRLARRYPTEVVPGVSPRSPRPPPRLGRPLVERDEVADRPARHAARRTCSPPGSPAPTRPP